MNYELLGFFNNNGYPGSNMSYFNYNQGEMAFNMVAGIIGNIFSASNYGSSSYTDNSSTQNTNVNNGSSTDIYINSSYYNQIVNCESNIKNAAQNVDENNPSLQGNIDTANTKLSNYKTLKSNYTTAKNALDSATKPEEPAADADEAARQKYAKDKAAYQALEDAVAKAKNDLANAGFADADKDYTEDIEAEITGATNARNEAINQYTQEQKRLLEQAKTNARNELGLGEKLNQQDGSWLSRQFDGKNSVKDQMAAFRKASAKFAENPYSLSAKEIAILKSSNVDKLVATIQSSDNTEGMRSVIQSLQAWNTNDKQAALTRAENALNGKISTSDFQELQKYGYFKKSDRNVTQNGTQKRETIYTGGGHSYILDSNGTPININSNKDGNLFHKATYTVE